MKKPNLLEDLMWDLIGVMLLTYILVGLADIVNQLLH